MATQPVNPCSSKRTFASVDLSTAAAATSETVSLTGYTLCGVLMSTSWTDAKLSFLSAVDGTTNYQPLFDTSGNNLTYTTSASRVVVFDPAVFMGLPNIQLASMTSAGVAVAQAGARTLKLALAKLVE